MIKKYFQFIKENQSKDLIPQDWRDRFEIEGDNIILHHFGAGDIEYLDPNKWGAHEYTKSEDWWGKPRVYFYTDPKDQEKVVGGTHYTVKYPLEKLYPFNADPLNFYDECAIELETENIPVRRQTICISSKAEKAGYDGMIYRWQNTFLAVIWVKVPVEKAPVVVKDNTPTTDYIGWSIKNGMSTDPDLTTDEERKQRVQDTIDRRSK